MLLWCKFLEGQANLRILCVDVTKIIICICMWHIGLHSLKYVTCCWICFQWKRTKLHLFLSQRFEILQITGYNGKSQRVAFQKREKKVDSSNHPIHKYSEEVLWVALIHVRKNISVRKASRIYNAPKTTPHDR